MTAVVELAGVSIVRGGALLLDGIDWTVDEADRWVVIGPNGAGKTTLLQILAAQIHPTAGVAGLLGEVLGAVDVFELRPRIGLTSAALADRLPRASVSRMSWSPRRTPYSAAGARSTTNWTTSGPRSCWPNSASRTSPTARSARCPRGSGSGSRSPGALMTDPELMLMDEPAAGLDLTGREQLVRSLSSIATAVGAPAMVLVTHHVEEIPPGFTHALLLKEGRIVAAGPMDQALTAETLERHLRPGPLPQAGGRPLHRPRPLTRRSRRAGLTRPNICLEAPNVDRLGK